MIHILGYMLDIIYIYIIYGYLFDVRWYEMISKDP